MKDLKCSTVLFAIALSILCALLCSAQDTPRKTLKHAIKKEDPQEFLPFIKEREYLDSPYAIASPEAEQLLNFIERTMIPNGANEKSSNSDSRWKKEFISSLREGEGQYLKISQNVYIVQKGSTLRVADLNKKSFDVLMRANNLEIIEKGFLSDGTGWLLCYDSSLMNSHFGYGYNFITYMDVGVETKIQNTPLVGEVMGYSVNEAKKGSFKYYCSESADRIQGIAGEITGYYWQDIGSSGAKKIVFTVFERNCDNFKSKNVKKKIGFIISKGEVTPFKSQ